MKQIILATNNQNKLREISQMLRPLGIEVLSQSQAGVQLDVEETGTTFAENAELKARAFYEKTGKPVLADDSGLAVDALNGRGACHGRRPLCKAVAGAFRCAGAAAHCPVSVRHVLY